MKKSELNFYYKQFCDKIISRGNLESSVFTYYFKNQEKTFLSHWVKDEYEDFVSWFYPRLKKAIDNYFDKGHSFEAFMNKYFLVASREYRIRTITKNVTEYSAWSARIPDFYAHEEAPEYNNNGESEILLSKVLDNKNGRKNTRRVLALIIKCYSYISDDFIERAAPVLNLKKEELREMLNKIRLLNQKRDDAIYLMKERQYCLFYKSIMLEKKVLLSRENTTTHNKLKKQLNNTKIKLEKIRIKLSRMRKEASNSQVAQVIGVCKGSIDSSLYKLKEKINLN